MLYDIMPPVAFLGSLGGIIWIISRVVARIRRTALSASISSAAEEEDTTVSTNTIQPQQSRIQLLKNRREWMKAVTGRVRQQVPGMVTALRTPFSKAGTWWKERRERKAEQEQLLTIEPEVPSVTSTLPTPEVKPAITLTAVEKKEEKIVSSKKITSPTFFKKKPKVSVLEQAQEALSQAHYDQAENILVPYIFSHTKDINAYMLLGRVAIARTNWEEAIEIFEQVVKRNPKEPGAWSLLGEAAYKSGHFTRALQALQRANEADPEDTHVLEHLLSIARKMDNRGLQESVRSKMEILKQADAVRA